MRRRIGIGSNETRDRENQIWEISTNRTTDSWIVDSDDRTWLVRYRYCINETRVHYQASEISVEKSRDRIKHYVEWNRETMYLTIAPVLYTSPDYWDIERQSTRLRHIERQRTRIRRSRVVKGGMRSGLAGFRMTRVSYREEISRKKSTGSWPDTTRTVRKIS